MRLTLVRNATLVVELAGRRLLVDPMLGEQEAYPPIEGTPNPRRNPLVPLPDVPLEPLDALVVTHLHNDHWDAAARERLAKELPVFTQPPSADAIRDAGFRDVRAVDVELEWEGIRFARTGGRHGHGDLANRLGPVSGFVLRAPGEPVLWIAGDTVWCEEVEEALAAHRPDVAVVNAGGAVFVGSEPIVMDPADVRRVVDAGPRVVAVHLEALNHCPVTRAELRAAVPEALVPEDGETLEL